MDRKFHALALAFAMLVFTGCIQEEFYQKVGRDGRSVMTARFDFTQAVELSGQYGSAYGIPNGISEDDAAAQLQASCDDARQKAPELQCTVNGTVMMMQLPLEPDNRYYSWETRDGIPYRTYRLTVRRIPLDKFYIKSPLETGPLAPAKALDLNDKPGNAQTAQGLAPVKDFVFTYAVEMPAPLESARAGAYAAVIDPKYPNAATFDMVAVLADSEPLVVEAKELNVLAIVALAAGLLLVAATAVYFWPRK